MSLVVVPSPLSKPAAALALSQMQCNYNVIDWEACLPSRQVRASVRIRHLEDARLS